MRRTKRPANRLARLRALLATRAGGLLVRLTVAALVFLLAGIVVRQARAYAYRLDHFRVTASSLEFTGLPEWADARVRRVLQPRYVRPFSVSIYDPDAEATVRARIERHPLVREAGLVRLLYPNRAQVRPTLRVPVAQVSVWVRTRAGHQVQRTRLLSDDGCLLPRRPYGTYLEGLPYELPLVCGIRECAPLDAGEVWEDRTERVQEAVAAAQLAPRLFRDFRGRVTLERVDVSRFPATGASREAGEVRLTIGCPPARRGGPRVERVVEWGRTERAGAEVPWEDDYRTKVRRLWAALTAPHAASYVDVRWELGSPPRTGP
jgi:hypothetical protein